MGPDPIKSENFHNWSPTLWEGQTDLSGQLRACFDPFSAVVICFWPILAPFLPCLETVMESQMGSNPVKNDFFQKWPPTLWARFDQFYGYTGYRVADTGTPTIFQYAKRAKSAIKRLIVRSSV